MLLLLALLPWAGVAASSPEAKPDAAAACQDGGCGTSGLSLLQQKNPRVGRSAEPMEEDEEDALEAGSSAELIQERADEEEAKEAEALYERQVGALLQRVKDGRQWPRRASWGSPPNCPVCEVAGPDATFDGAAAAGKVWTSTKENEKEEWQCSKAQAYVNEASKHWNACPEFPSVWTANCCKTATGAKIAGANSECKELCPGDQTVLKNWAGKYAATGKAWTCARAARVLRRLQGKEDHLRTSGPPTCIPQRQRWRGYCCSALQPACSMCPRGKMDVIGAKPVDFNGQSATCQDVFAKLQQEDSNGCSTGINQYAHQCCQSEN